jgi:HAD superfamily hydrolase (TIGR01509 family)
LFDHDGVLVDTEHLYYRATKETLASVAVELTLADYLAIQVIGGNAWTGMLESGYSEAAVAQKRVERNELYQVYLRTEDIDIADVERVLSRLSARFGLAIVTTARQNDFDLIHAERNITAPFDLILTNKDYARSKPHPDPYLAALDHFNIGPRDALVVEDSERGLRSAVAAGIDCACVHHPFTAPQDFSQATYRIQNLAELLELLHV